jgi:hypothetical protein
MNNNKGRMVYAEVTFACSEGPMDLITEKFSTRLKTTDNYCETVDDLPEIAKNALMDRVMDRMSSFSDYKKIYDLTEDISDIELSKMQNSITDVQFKIYDTNLHAMSSLIERGVIEQ